MDRSADLLARALAAVDDYIYVWEYYVDGSSAPLFESVGSFAFLGETVDGERREEDVWRERIHPDDRAVYDAVTDAQGRGQGGSAEYRLLHRDGTRMHVYDRWRGSIRADGVRLAEGIISNVTALKAAEEALRERDEQFRQLATSAPVGIYAADRDGHLTFVNERWRSIFGLVGDAGFGDTWTAAVHPDDRASTIRDWRLAVAAGGAWEREYRVVRPDGEVRWVESRGNAVRGVDGAVVGFIGTDDDVTERRRAQAALERLSHTDALTGLPNRRRLTARLQELLDALAPDSAAWPALVLLDVDHFKRINDTSGHGVGDQVLVEAGRRLAAGMRPGDLVARWGGEEFALLFSGVAGEDELFELAEAIRGRLGAELMAGFSVSASAGAVLATDSVRSADAMLHAADRALYAAKRRGRNQTRLAARLTSWDLIPEEPEAVRVAQGLALAASVREGSQRVGAAQIAELALGVAETLGLPQPVALRCRLAALLHDVGKVAIPDRVLLKRERLDPQELEVLRMHAEIGERIVLQNPLLRDAAPAVRHHHERWDGTGYPDGLAGADIPVEARVVAVADAYAALTQDRPDRRGLDQDEALAEICRNAGTQFDARAVDALCTVLRDVRARPRAA